MAEFSLIPHPDHATHAVNGVRVQVDSEPEYLSLIYSVDIDLPLLNVPPKAKSFRADGLWRSTCFEIFLQTTPTEYLEFNFSPSSQWAAYHFDAYRSGMRPINIGEEALLDAPPKIWTEYGAGLIGFHLGTALGPLCGGASIGLTAIIEETDGTKSYWALAHAPGPPDFHNPDCFTARLPAPELP